MRVIIKKNYEECSKWAANYIADRIKRFRPTAEKPFVLGLPTGSTPLGIYKELISLFQKGKVSFANVVTFNMDEYIGLDASHRKAITILCGKTFFPISILKRAMFIFLTA